VCRLRIFRERHLDKTPQLAIYSKQVQIISGRVLQVADGAPIAFASVIVGITSSGQSLSGALTSEDGRFRVQGSRQASTGSRSLFPGSSRPWRMCS
jgi:hypothetical protein